MSNVDFVGTGQRVLQVELNAIEALRPLIGDDFRRACELLMA